MDQNIPKAFFAYPSNRSILMEAIREAVNELNASKQIDIKTWEECNIGGKLIINTIYEEIDRAQLFFADITGLNPNVMFELGYAIACNKRIWLIIDTTYANEKKKFDQFQILKSVGYIHFCNSQDIISGFYNQNPTEDIKATIFHTEIEPNLKPGGYRSILHLMSLNPDQAALRISQSLEKKLNKNVIVDDPNESPVRKLSWYGGLIFGCKGLVCQFMNPERDGADIQNARNALVCGMAHGVKISKLMLAEENFEAPSDFRDYLNYYRTAPDALSHLEKWFPSVEEILRNKEKSTTVPHAIGILATDLRNLRFGDHVAENEAESLVSKYFIPTVAYEDAVNGSQNVFIGRKGSGKTANLMKLEDELGRHKKNLVCVIKPERFQMLGIVDLLKQYKHRNVKAYAIESLWKLLLFTEIANTVYNNPPVRHGSDVDQIFFKFVETNKNFICKDFSSRLDSCIQNLDRAIGKSNDENSYLPISEALHSHTLKRLRSELGKYLSSEQRVSILVDNLDQAWERQNDIEALSEILWGLLEIAKDLPRDLQKEDSRRPRIRLSLAIFLRSDIFYKIRKVAREPDKMPYSLLKWDDTELLCSIIEERFLSAFETAIDPEVLWDKYFCPMVNGVPTREYIISVILRRPRDIIYFVNEAITSAINKRHTRVEMDDILNAQLEYSFYALEIINIENTIPDINLSEVLFGFAKMSATITRQEVLETLDFFNIPEEKIEPIIDVLHDLTFLGREVEKDSFVFSETPEDSEKNKIVARKYAWKQSQEERYQIHKAFHAFLDINET